MSFWDTVGHVADATGNFIAHGDIPPSFALRVAQTFDGDMTDSQKDSFKAAITSYNQNYGGVATAFGTIGGGLLDGLNYAGDKVRRGASTTVQGVDDSIMGRDVDWRQNWNQSKNVSIGQAVVGTTMNAFGSNLNLDSAAQRKKVFEDNPWGRLASGALDVAADIGLDPLTYLAPEGKIVQGGLGALRDVSRLDEASKAAVLSGKDVAQAKGLSAPKVYMASRLDKFIESTKGKSASELYATGMFKQSSDGGALASLFGSIDADKTLSDIEKAADKRRVLAAAFGDKQALGEINAKNNLAAMQLDGMTRDISALRDLVDWYKPFSPGQHKASYDLYKGELQATKAQQDQIATVLENQRKLLDIGRIDPNMKNIPLSAGMKNRNPLGQQARVVATVTDVNSTLQGIHVITGKHLPGEIDVKDPGSIDHFRNWLAATGRITKGPTGNKTPIMGAALRQHFLDSYIAATPEVRHQITAAAEDALFGAVAKRYMPGGSADEVRALLNSVRTRKASMLRNLQSRAYSSLDDGKDWLLHAEDGQWFATDRPLLGPQLTTNVHLLDPAALIKTMQLHATEHTGLAGLVQKVQRGAEHVWDLTEPGVAAFNNLWKFGSLFRLAYPLRIQADDQSRLLATMHAAYFPLLWDGVKENTRYTVDSFRGKIPTDPVKEILDGTKKPLTRSQYVFQRQAAKKAEYKGVQTTPLAQNESQISNLVDSIGGGMRTEDFMSDLQSTILADLRRTGHWDRIAGDHLQWVPDYRRIVNKQLRNDPIAWRLLQGASEHDIVNWLYRTPEGQSHWLKFKRDYDRPEDLVARIAGHTDNLLPVGSAAREAARAGDLGIDQVKQLWPDPGMRPKVNADQMIARDGTEALAHKVKELQAKYFKWANDANELTLSRHPYYRDRYAAFMRGAIDKAEQTGRLKNGKFIDSADLYAMQQAAETHARQMVGKLLFDTSQRSNLGHMLRYVMPFYSAWADTMTKWSRIVGANPIVGQIAANELPWAPNNLGLVQDDDGNAIHANGDVVDADGKVVGKAGRLDGNIIIPMDHVGLGWLKDKTGWKNIKISKNNANLLFQGSPFWLPSTGPLVTVPVNAFYTKMFPEAYKDEGITHWLLPYGTDDNSVDVALPSWIRHAKDAADTHSKNYQQQLAIQLAQASNENRMQGKGWTPKEVRDKAMQRTRNAMIFQAIASNAAPVAVQGSPRLQWYIDQYHKLQRKNAATAQDQFFKLYPEAYEMAISLSTNPTGIQASDKAWTAIKGYRQEIAADPEFGWMYAGSANIGGGFSNAVYDAQLGQYIASGSNAKFRTTRDADSALAAVQTNEGWNEYTAMMTKFDLDLEDRGLTSFQSNGAEDLAQGRRDAIATLEAKNPSWAKEFGKRDSQSTAHFIQAAQQAMTNHPELTKRGDFKLLQDYLEQRNELRDELAQRKSSTLDAAENYDLQSAWTEYVTGLTRKNVGFMQMYQRELIHDDPSQEV